MRLQLFATQLAVVPLALLDWGVSPTTWRSLPAALGLYALLALPMGLIGGAFERLWRPMGEGLAKVARNDANRLGFLVGISVTVAVQMMLILWSNRFNAPEIAALAAALGLLPAGTIGLASGLVVRRVSGIWLRGAHGRTTTWLAVLGLGATTALLIHRAQRPDLWATVHRPLIAYLPLLPGLWIITAQRIRAWERRPRWLVNIFPLPLLFATLWIPPVAAELVRSEGLCGDAVMLLRSALDSDGDGFSSWLGGGDCNDGNAEINPGAFDRPKDDIDQDCDGADFHLPKADRSSQFVALPSGKRAARNLLFITVDTLRADRISWYGSPNDTMPNTQKLLVDQDAAFMRAYANGVRSQRSVPSMVIGRYPSRLNWGEDGRDAVTLSAKNHSLGELLEQAGFETHAVIMERYFSKQKGLTQGWTFHRARAIAPGKIDWSSSTSPAITRFTTKLLRKLQKAPDRWAIWVHYYDPHIRFARSRFGHDAMARYDESLAITDEWLAPLLKAVDLDNTVVALASDHGQGLGTHGHHGHGSNLYEEDIHVPLVFAGAGIAKGRHQAVVQNVDIVPTVLNMLDLASAETIWDGRSLVPALLGGVLADRPAFAEALPDPHTTDHAWAIISGQEKLIHDLRRNTQTIFHLGRDPKEGVGRAPRGSDSTLVRALNTHRSTAELINRGDYGGKQKKLKKPKKRPDRLRGELEVDLSGRVRLAGFSLLDPPHAGARLRLRLNLTVLEDFSGTLNAMVHLEGRTANGKKIFLNRDQAIRPKPVWKVGDQREVVVSFVVPRSAKGGQVSALIGLFRPRQHKWKAVGNRVGKKGRVVTARFTLR